MKRFMCSVLLTSLFLDEIAVFEELMGSHGGLAGDQSKPFIIYPSECNLEKGEIIGAEKIYDLLKPHITDTLD